MLRVPGLKVSGRAVDTEVMAIRRFAAAGFLGLAVLLASRAAVAFEFEPRTLLYGQVPETADDSPRTATDGHGRWVTIWSSRAPIAGTGYDFDILAAHSDDGGQTWSAPAPVNADATTDHIDYAQDMSPQLFYVEGRWRAFWWKTIGQVRLFGARSDDGVHWTPDVAVPFEGSNPPHVATDGKGTWLLVWRPIESGRVASLRSIDDGVTWQPRVDLAVQPFGMNLLMNPQAASDGADSWLVVWRGGNVLGSALGTDADVLAVRSHDGGATWDAPTPIEPDAATDERFDDLPMPIHLPDGSWLVVWRDGGAGVTAVSVVRSVDGGQTWTPKIAFGPGGSMTATHDGVGEVVVVWAADGDWPSVNMTAVRSRDGGQTWSDPLRIGPGNLSPSPSLATDGFGRWLVTWATTRRPDGEFAQYQDIVVARGALCGDGHVGPPETCEPGGGCCSPTCHDMPSGTPCTVDACHPAATCDAGECLPGPPVACAACTACDPANGCVAHPRESCRRAVTARSGLLQVEHSRRRFRWQWQRGAATTLEDFGDPMTSDGFALCVYDRSAATPALLSRAVIPAGGLCRGRPCWKPGRSGFAYRDRDASADAITSLVLRSGADGRASIQLSGNGPALALEQVPVALPVTVQLHAAGGTCWEGTFSPSGVVRNDAAALRARPD